MSNVSTSREEKIQDTHTHTHTQSTAIS